MPLDPAWLAQTLRPLIGHPPERFSGLGLIVYRPPLALPTTPLIPCEQSIADLPKHIDEGIALLARLADRTGPFHDGFHLIDGDAMALTHVCQYVAPHIPSGPPRWKLGHSVGARYMTALLASLTPGVTLAATVSVTGEMSLFEDGTVTGIHLLDGEGA